MGSASSKYRRTNHIAWIPITILLLLAITASAAPITNTSDASSLAHHAPLTSRGWLRRPHRITPVISSQQNETTRTGLNFNFHSNNLDMFPTITADESSSPSIHLWPNILPTQPLASNNSTRNSLDKRGKKSSKLRTFDGRPIEYFNQSLPYAPAKDRGPERDRKLEDLWNQTLNIKNLDGENIDFGPEKGRIFQLWDIKLEAPFKDHSNDTPDTRKTVNFITWLFEIPEETLGWFVNSNRWLSRPGAVEDREYLEPIDHYNWIAKAHSFLRSFTAAEQMEINTRIDNIDKLDTANLYKLYDTFEIRENMIFEHKIQAAEFLQVQELTFPAANDSGSGLISTRKPIVLKDWKKDDDSRIHQFQDAGARYWVPASDSNHTDWASLTRAMIAHKTITEQRMIRHQAREFPKNFMNVTEQRSFYESIGINPDGKDSDDIKKVAAYMLCVEELAFPEKPKSKKGKAVPVAPGDIPVPQMTDICDAQQQQERLKNLFFIERWDADHAAAQTSSQDKGDLYDEVGPAGNEVEDTITASFDDFDEEFDTLINEAATSSTQAKRGLPEQARGVENEIRDSIRTPYNEATEALGALKNATTPPSN